MHGYTHVISQSILHRKLPCHACYVIMFCPHKQILQGNQQTMHGYILMFCGQIFCEDIILAIDC